MREMFRNNETQRHSDKIAGLSAGRHYFGKIILNSKDIIKSIIDPDDYI